MKRYKEWLLDSSGLVKKSVRIMIFVCILIMALVESLFLYYHSPEEKMWLVCVFYKLCGYYCPGCGSGRACYSLLHGKLYQAFRYNPLMCMLLPWFILYTGICMIQWVVHGRETISRKIPVWTTYILFSIVILYGILRNIDIYPFTLLAPARMR